MRPAIVATIAKKELREALRDRRTLFMMVLLPVLLYPALLVLATQVSAAQMTELEEANSQVGVYGAAPDHPVFETLNAHEKIDTTAIDTPALGTYDVVVDVSDWPATFDPAIPAEVDIIFESIHEGSWKAVDRIEERLAEVSEAELLRRIEANALPERFAEPMLVNRDNRTTSARQGGFVLGSILPILVLVTVLMGAYYPAIDLTAGEKERSTIQTLFTAPIAPIEIVAGKYVAVVGIAGLSGGANLLSMALVLGQNLLVAPELAEQLNLTISFPVFLALGWTVAMLALFFSALLLAVAVLARSFKEAQTYTTPVFLVCLVPAMIAQLPGFELNAQLALVPAMGPILLMKALLVDGVQMDTLFLVSAGTLVWTALSLVLASRLFGQESVIVGERGALHLIPRRADIKPKARPRISDAFAWYAVLFVLLFYVGATVQAKAPQPGLLFTLWGLLLLPTIGLIRFTKLDWRETLNWRPAKMEHYAATILFALSALILVNWLNGLIDTHLLQAPPELAEEMAKFFPPPEGAIDWFWLLFLIAFTPAVCEEVVFRGYILSGLRDRLPDWQVALIVGLLFGAFHLSIFRMFGTTVLGVLMALLVLRTRSIFPAMLFHFLNNGLAIIGTYGVPAGTLETIPPAAIAISLPMFGVSWYLLDRSAPATERRREL